MKKKKKQKSGWATAHFCTWSQYSTLYHDTGRKGMQQGGHDMARRPCDTAARHGRPSARACGNVHSRYLAGGGGVIQMLYRGWGRLLGRDTTRETADDTAACVLQYGAGCT